VGAAGMQQSQTIGFRFSPHKNGTIRKIVNGKKAALQESGFKTTPLPSLVTIYIVTI
jgi:hypothetical protein